MIFHTFHVNNINHAEFFSTTHACTHTHTLTFQSDQLGQLLDFFSVLVWVAEDFYYLATDFLRI